jgi:hypothetical protein
MPAWRDCCLPARLHSYKHGSELHYPLVKRRGSNALPSTSRVGHGSIRVLWQGTRRTPHTLIVLRSWFLLPPFSLETTGAGP